jgi:prefoldin subunit 5
MREVGENCEYLDTRAYLHFRLGKYDVALQEMQAAIRMMDQQRMGLQLDWNPEFIRGRPVDEYALAREKKVIEQNLAVMYHHRGEIYQKLAETHKDQDAASFKKNSDADFQRAAEYGFDPKNGVL